MMSFEVKNLSAERNHRLLFKDLSFTLRAGECLQILGENGAGKTTLLRTLSGLMPILEGSIHWKDDLIYIGHQNSVKAHLTPRENLKFMMALTGFCTSISIEQALETMDLQSLAHVPTHTLSAGQQRRLGLARLLFNSARLWILDEPLTALDQKGIQLIEQLLKTHLKQQGLLILTSHQPLKIDGFVLRELRLAP